MQSVNVMIVLESKNRKDYFSELLEVNFLFIL